LASTGEGASAEQAAPETDTATTQVKGAIIQIIPSRDESILLINRRVREGVKADSEGWIIGLENTKFRIIEVYQFRSKATLPLPDKRVGRLRDVVITISPDVEESD